MSDTIVLRNPATTEVVAELALAGRSEVDAAVARAAAAAPAWRAVAPADRARLLRRFADTIAAHADELAALETRNMGMPIGNSTWCANAAADVIHYFAGAVDKHTGSTIPVGRRCRHDVPRAARRGGVDHALELPGADGVVEDRARRWRQGTLRC